MIYVGRIVSGLVLIAASMLKSQAIHWDRVEAELGTWGPLVMAEMMLGMWALSNWKPRGYLWVAIFTFSLFLSVQISNGLNGTHEDCGCFGPTVQVPRGVVFFLDIFVLICLIIEFQAHRKRKAEIRHKLTFVQLIFMVIPGTVVGICGLLPVDSKSSVEEYVSEVSVDSHDSPFMASIYVVDGCKKCKTAIDQATEWSFRFGIDLNIVSVPIQTTHREMQFPFWEWSRKGVVVRRDSLFF